MNPQDDLINRLATIATKSATVASFDKGAYLAHYGPVHYNGLLYRPVYTFRQIDGRIRMTKGVWYL